MKFHRIAHPRGRLVAARVGLALGLLATGSPGQGCQGEVAVTETPTPPPDPHDPTGPDEVIYWDPLSETTTSATFYDLTGFGDRDVYLAGDGGRVWRWDGSELSLLVTLSTPDGTVPDLYGVWALSDAFGRLLYVVGSDGAIYRYDFLPGDELTGEDFELLETGTRSTFNAVFGLDRETVWAVGDGGAYGLDGDTWYRDAGAPGGVSLLDVWGYRDGDVEVFYAAGRSGILLMRREDPSAGETPVWTPVSLGRGEDLHSVWGFDDGTLFVAGQYGLILGFDGTEWSTWDTGVFDHLWGIWGPTPERVFAVGTSATTLVFDGTAWQHLAADAYLNLYGVWGTTADHVFAAGAGGTLLLYDGDPTPPPADQAADQRSIPAVGHFLEGLSRHGTENATASELGRILHGSGQTGVDSSHL